MPGFIAQVAESLYNKYGDEISSLTILFPSRRARLFFNDALSKLAGKPLWQPDYSTVDAVMEEVSGLATGDSVRVVTELYKIYSEYHRESFDSFYFWGEMLLSDFDSIDKYLIDADMLFANVSDLKDIEADFEYLNPEQAEVVARFWRSFGHQAEFSEEKQKFIDIWHTLAPVYHCLRARLTELGIAYTGMLYRRAAEVIKSGKAVIAERKFVIAGFNALSESEKVLFKFLANNCDVEFFWDYDRYYLDDANQEAGLFLRDNINRFPQKTPIIHNNNSFVSPKEIIVVSSPSDTMQCKYVGEVLKEIEAKQGRKAGTETAIVLTDENLLVPVLHSIPSDIDKINVTMGYPIRATSAYTFVERLLLLQSRRRAKGDSVRFYHSDVTGLLRHPYVVSATAGDSMELADKVTERQHIYIDSVALGGEGILGKVFAKIEEGWTGVSYYLLDVLSEITRHWGAGQSNEDKQQLEFISLISDNINKLANSLSNCDIDISEKIYASLLRKMLQNIRIPFEGEPLQGVQVMGILETRNLDFKNVILLSMTDDTFPGNRAASSSFIPYNLRLAYGLPTPAHHEGVYAYYFYRLLQRAESVHMVYSSRADEKSSGEQSRYIYQLQYESPHKITRRAIGLDVNTSPSEPIMVEKSGAVADKLSSFLMPDTGTPAKRKLSPTSFFNFITCPLKFYFHSIAGLAEDREISEDIDAPMFGTILHAAMEALYAPIIGKPAPNEYLASLINTDKVEAAVREAITREYFHGADTNDEDYGGSLLLVRDIVIKYINKCILPYDAAQSGFVVEKMEEQLLGCVGFDTAAGRQTVAFGGLADRVDRLDSGMYRVVDYKTGKDHLVFNGVEGLFSDVMAEQNSAALQTLLYAMMMSQQTGTAEIQPALYYVRQMNREDYSPLLDDKARGGQVLSYLDYKDEFEARLSDKLAELFDTDTPFRQCADAKQCEWCDFNVICKR